MSSSEELLNCRRLLGAMQLINVNEAACVSNYRSPVRLAKFLFGQHTFESGRWAPSNRWRSWLQVAQLAVSCEKTESKQNQDQVLVPRAGCLLAHLPLHLATCLKQSAQKVTTIEQNTFLCFYFFASFFFVLLCPFSIFTPPPHLFFLLFALPKAAELQQCPLQDVAVCVCAGACVLDKDASFLLLAWHFEKCSQRVASTLSGASFCSAWKPAAFEVCVSAYVTWLHVLLHSLQSPVSRLLLPESSVLPAPTPTALGNNLKCKIMRKAGAVRQTQDAGCHLLTANRVALVVLVVGT